MDHRVTRVIERMHERLRAETSIDTLAAEVGLSTSRPAVAIRQWHAYPINATLQTPNANWSLFGADAEQMGATAEVEIVPDGDR